MAEDITKLLKEDERFIGRILETTPNIIYIYDIVEQRNVYINRLSQTFIGYTADEIQGLGGSLMPTILHPDDAEAVARHHARFRQLADNVVLELEYRMRHSTGRWRWLRSRDVLFARDDDGRGRLILGTAEDITQRKEAEQERKESIERLQLATAAARLGIWDWWSASGRIFWDARMCELYGLPPGGTPQSFSERLALVHPEDRAKYERTLREVLDGGSDYQVDFRIESPQAGIRTITEFGMVARSESGAPVRVTGINVDITDRKRTEREQLRYEQQLQQQHKLEALGLLAGGIAHDFNNVSQRIFGYIELANETNLDDEARSYLGEAMKGIDRARDLAEQLLTFAKGGEPKVRADRLFPMVKDTIEFALAGSKMSCIFEVQPDLWLSRFDRNRIAQVIDNIVINAKQAMGNEGVLRIAARNLELHEGEHAWLRAGRYVRISIEDSGPGIEKHLQDRIFDPFFTTKTLGHGLGLATSRSILDRHGGTLELESDVGRGSTFHLLLPATSKPATPDEQSSMGSHRGSGTFVVVDDEGDICIVLSRALRSMGYRPVTFARGEDALDFLEKEHREGRPISGMILDLTIPTGKGGKETVVPVRRLFPDVPVFVASGYHHDPIMAHPRRYGFTASISKPFTKSELARLLALHQVP